MSFSLPLCSGPIEFIPPSPVPLYSLEKVESAYAGSKYVEQICVHADVGHPSLICVIIPNTHQLAQLATSIGITNTSDMNALCNDKKLKEELLKDLNAKAKEAKLFGFEMVQNLWLDTEPFSVENDLLTPSLKMRRPNFKKKYEKQIEQMFAELAAKPQKE